MLTLNPNIFQAIAGVVLLVIAVGLVGFLFGMPLIDKIKSNRK